MAWIKRVAKWTGLGLLGLCLIGLAWPWSYVLRERITSGEYVAHLADNSQPIELARADGGIEFPESFYENKLFLLGEIHGAQLAQDVDFAMMVHLNQRLGITTMMAELSPLKAARFNAYLASGDEGQIDPVFERWLASATQWGNQQHYEKLVALRAYNQSIAPEQRISYFGVDLIDEDEREDAAQWLAGMLAQLPVEDETSVGRLEVALSQEYNEARIAEALSEALPALDKQAETAAESDWAMAAYFADNLHSSIEGAGRYDVIPANIDAMVNQFGIGDDEPIYGFWGLFHVMKATVNETGVPLALQLEQSDLPFADGIASVLMVYADSTQNMPSDALPDFLRGDGPFTDFTMSQDSPYLMYLYGIGDLKQVATSEATLFSPFEGDTPYAGDNRLFKQSGLLTQVSRFELDPAVARPVDHIILIDGSEALTPWVGSSDTAQQIVHSKN